MTVGRRRRGETRRVGSATGPTVKMRKVIKGWEQVKQRVQAKDRHVLKEEFCIYLEDVPKLIRNLKPDCYFRAMDIVGHGSTDTFFFVGMSSNIIKYTCRDNGRFVVHETLKFPYPLLTLEHVTGYNVFVGMNIDKFLVVLMITRGWVLDMKVDTFERSLLVLIDSGILILNYKVWSTAIKVIHHQFSGHRDSVKAIACHQKEPVVVSASTDGWVYIWRLDTLRKFKQVKVSNDTITHLKISSHSDPETVGFWCNSENRVYFYELAEIDLLESDNLHMTKPLQAHHGRVMCLVALTELTSDRSQTCDTTRVLLSAGSDMYIKVWRLRMLAREGVGFELLFTSVLQIRCDKLPKYVSAMNDRVAVVFTGNTTTEMYDIGKTALKPTGEFTPNRTKLIGQDKCLRHSPDYDHTDTVTDLRLVFPE
ncbi:hypothetical protein ACOMHN_049442 [Nucella lapillus]